MIDKIKYLEEYYNERFSDCGPFDKIPKGFADTILNSLGFNTWFLSRRLSEVKKEILKKLHLS